MKILLLAYACRPDAGSEWHVGWEAYQTLAKHHEVVVITSEFNKKFIEQYLQDHPEHAKNCFIYLGKKTSWVENRLVARMQDWFSYLLWCNSVRKQIPEIIRHHKPEVGIHSTIATWRVASPLEGSGLPWIWGPIGGATTISIACLGILSKTSRVFELARSVANAHARINPRIKKATRDCRLLLVNAKETGAIFEKMGANPEKIQILSQTFLANERFKFLSEIQSPRIFFPDTIQFLAGGTCEGLKGVELTLQTLRRLKAKNIRFEYRFLGRGSELDFLKNQARKYGLEDNVRLGEWIEGEQFASTLARSHIYLAPSLREGVPVMLIEAMSVGCIPIVLNCGGPGLVVDNQCGRAVNPESPEQIVRELLEKVLEILESPSLASSLSLAAKDKVGRLFTRNAYELQINKAIALAASPHL